MISCSSPERPQSELRVFLDPRESLDAGLKFVKPGEMSTIFNDMMSLTRMTTKGQRTMANTTLTKQEDKPVSAAQQMSYVEALQVIEKQNLKIKEAAKNRLQKARSFENDLFARNLGKSFGTIGVTVATLITLGTTGSMDHTLAGISAMVVSLGGGLGSVVLCHRSKSLLSPIKYRQFMSKYNDHENLRSLKESEYAKVEAKALKKASAAIEVANKTLASKSKKVAYSNKLSKEGFSVVEVGDSGDITQEMLRAISESEQSNLPVHDATKAIAGTKMKELEPSF